MKTIVLGLVLYFAQGGVVWATPSGKNEEEKGLLREEIEHDLGVLSDLFYQRSNSSETKEILQAVMALSAFDFFLYEVTSHMDPEQKKSTIQQMVLLLNGYLFHPESMKKKFLSHLFFSTSMPTESLSVLREIVFSSIEIFRTILMDEHHGYKIKDFLPFLEYKRKALKDLVQNSF